MVERRRYQDDPLKYIFYRTRLRQPYYLDSFMTVPELTHIEESDALLDESYLRCIKRQCTFLTI